MLLTHQLRSLAVLAANTNLLSALYQSLSLFVHVLGCPPFSIAPNSFCVISLKKSVQLKKLTCVIQFVMVVLPLLFVPNAHQMTTHDYIRFVRNIVCFARHN